MEASAVAHSKHLKTVSVTASDCSINLSPESGHLNLSLFSDTSIKLIAKINSQFTVIEFIVIYHFERSKNLNFKDI